jgi:uncharacterized protein involved in outer membrane biogenesis
MEPSLALTKKASMHKVCSSMAKKTFHKIFATLIGLILLYAVIGFFILPRVARNQIIQAVQDRYGVAATVEKISFNPFNFEFSVTNLRIPSDAAEGATPDRLVLGQLSVNLQIFPLLDKRIVFKSFYLGDAELDFTVFKNGATNWTPTSQNAEVAPTKTEQKKSKPWVLTLERFQLENTKLDFLDQTHREPLNLPLGPINLLALNISTSLGSKTSLEQLNVLFGTSGRLQVGGQLSLDPLSADIHFDVSRLPLDFMTSYLSDKTHLAVKSGELNIKGTATYRESQAKLKADAKITGLDLIHPKTAKSALLWKTLDMMTLTVQTSPLQVRIDEVTMTGLNTSLILKKDGLLNYKDYLREGKGQTEKSKPIDFEVSRFKIDNGQLKYSDQQIKPNFNARIDRVSGIIEPLTLDTGKKINVNLVGRVEAQGKFQARGFVVPNSNQPKLDLDVDFNNIELTTFTPYAGKFAGYEITKGKMFLKLKYSLQNRFIRGQNNAVLDQFTLGKQVESDEATSLPLKLALALMKDRDGKIMINLPVEGDVNSPQFSISSMVWTALKNALINIVAAPFDFLKSVLGGGDNLNMVFFEPGKSVLSESELAKLQQISKVLSERPQLVIEVQGSTQLEDAEMLKKLKQKSSIPGEVLKALGEQRAQLVQNLFVSFKVEPERIFLVAATHIESGEKQPHSILYLKSRE